LAPLFERVGHRSDEIADRTCLMYGWRERDLIVDLKRGCVIEIAAVGRDATASKRFGQELEPSINRRKSGLAIALQQGAFAAEQ
jgi:hypothetical protein